jgi:hypothetical protein
VTKSRGIRKTKKRELCRKGLHKMTPLNTFVEADGSRRCIACREVWVHKMLRKKHKPIPTQSGKCTKGLHPWIPENWATDKEGNTRCRPCRRASANAAYHRKKHGMAYTHTSV